MIYTEDVTVPSSYDVCYFPVATLQVVGNVNCKPYVHAVPFSANAFKTHPEHISFLIQLTSS
jgi:hypothetical protein